MEYKLEATLSGHSARVWDAQFSSDGRRVVTVSQDRSVRVYAVSLGSSGISADVEKVATDAHKKAVRHVAWHPLENAFACSSFDGTVSVWDAAEKSQQSAALDWSVSATLEGHESETKGVAWSRDGLQLATSGRDKSVWVWSVTDVGGGERDYDCVSVLREHSGDVKTVFWSRQRDALYSCSYDMTVREWQRNSEEGGMEGDEGDEFVCTGTLEGHSGTVWCGMCSPCGRKVDGVEEMVTCSDDSTVMFWTRGKDGWKADQVVKGCFDGRPVYSVAWSCDGELVAAGCGDNTVRVYRRGADGKTFEEALCIPQAHEGDVNAVNFAPEAGKNNEYLLVSAGDDEVAKIWSIKKKN